MTTRPLVLLDIEGVVRVEPAKGYDYRSFERQDVLATHLGEPAVFDTVFDRAVVDSLSLLADDAEVRWHTMWGIEARTCFAPALGLPDWPVTLDRPDAADGYPMPGRWGLRWWKVQVLAAIAAVDPGRPVLWIDDSITEGLGRALDDLGFENVSWVVPRASRGLDRRDLDAVRQWIAAPVTLRRRRR